MDNSVPDNMDMLDSGYPRGVHDNVGHGCEPGLSLTSSCWRLPFVPGDMLLLLPEKALKQVA